MKNTLIFKIFIYLFITAGITSVSIASAHKVDSTNRLVVNTSSENGQWIGLKNVINPKNKWLAFRGVLNIENDTNKYVANIAADSKYWLWVNGQLVIFEGELKRGPNPRDTYYDKVDLSSYLKPGKNVIAVLVWYWGKEGFSYNRSGHAGLYFGLSRNTPINWRGIIHPAFGETGPPHPNYRLPESNIHFDARLDIPNWMDPNFDDSKWAPVENLGKNGDAPWGKLWERPVPMWYDSGLLNYVSTTREIKDERLIVKAFLPKNITITPYFKIKSKSGELIDMRTDNYKGGGAFNVRTEYVTKEGIQKFETYAYMNGHYVIYSFPKETKILDLKYRETKYNSQVIGSFKCDDPFYNTLWAKAINTLNVNMRDGIQDPDRERAQWWGDVVILMGEILYTLDENGHKAIDKAISNLVEWQKKSGVLYSPVPAGNWDKELPCQMLASVGDFGFWYYYQYSGKKQTISYVYPHVKKYLSLWTLNDKGLVKQRKGGWTWIDWGNNIDSSLIYNTWYYMALDAASKMAKIENDKDFENICLTRMNTIKNSFNREFWTGEGYRSQNYKSNYDDRGNALAVVSGLAKKSHWPAITKVLEENFHSSPYTEKYILEALFKMDASNQALQRMKDRYHNMVESPITTLWEGWGIGKKGYGGGTYNHGWSGGPLTLMMQYVAGISPLSPGWKSFQIAPQLGNLNSVVCSVPTPFGKIGVDINKSQSQFKINASFPDMIEGELYLPVRKDVKKIYINNLLVWENGEEIGSLKLVNFSIEGHTLKIAEKGLDKIGVRITN